MNRTPLTLLAALTAAGTSAGAAGTGGQGETEGRCEGDDVAAAVPNCGRGKGRICGEGALHDLTCESGLAQSDGSLIVEPTSKTP